MINFVYYFCHSVNEGFLLPDVELSVSWNLDKAENLSESEPQKPLNKKIVLLITILFNNVHNGILEGFLLFKWPFPNFRVDMYEKSSFWASYWIESS